MFRGSITRPARSLCTLRSVDCSTTTQHTVPAGGQPWPGGIGYPQGPAERFPSDVLHPSSSFPRLRLAQANLTFANFYVAGGAWQASDMQQIDRALAAAMTDPDLNNVMVQYFGGTPPTSTFTSSQTLAGSPPPHVSQGDIEQLVTTLQAEGKFAGFDLGSTVFNFMLPRGTILNDNPAPGAQQGAPQAKQRRGVPE